MRRARLFLGLDFDGTLAPIVRRPHAARLPARARRVLERLDGAPGVVVAVISGRRLDDLRSRVGLRRAAYAGNHGLELAYRSWRWSHPGLPRARLALDRALQRARGLCAAVPGAWVEDKGASLTFHVRAVRGRAAERRLALALRAVAAEEPALSFGAGKRVYELRPALRWDKGSAALLLRRRLAPGAPAVFVGDDVTDEDAFRALGPKALTVKVGPGATRARWRARDTRAVAALLERLATLFA